MKQPRFPSIVHHKARGAGVVFLRGANGKRRQIYLGTHGSADAPACYREAMVQPGYMGCSDAAELRAAAPPQRRSSRARLVDCHPRIGVLRWPAA